MSIYKKIAQELQSPFYDENNKDEISYDMFSRNYGLLKRYQNQIVRYFGIIKSRIGFDPKFNFGEDINSFINFFDQANYNLHIVAKLNEKPVEIENENKESEYVTQEKDEGVKSAIEAIASIFSKIGNSLEIVKKYAKNIDINSKYKKEEITFSDPNALQKKSPEMSKLDKLIYNVNSNAQKLGGSNLNISSFKDDTFDKNGNPNPNSKRRQLLNAINADAKQLLDSIKELYDYTKSTNQQVGKKTWNAKNYLGLIRSFVSGKEFQDMNNIYKSVQLLYNIN